MSMVCRVLGLSPDQVTMLRGKPALTGDVVRLSEHGETAPAVRHAMARMPMAERLAFAARLQPAISEIEQSKRRLTAFGPLGPALHLGTTWHTLHFVFTGRARPASRHAWHHFLTRRAIPVYDPADSLMSGEPVGPDLGHGPARLLDEAQVEAFSRFLDAQDADQLVQRVHFRKMTWLGIHGLPFGPRESIDFAGDVRAEVAAYFPLLRGYVTDVRQSGCGLLIWKS
jgi:hypothetical protein